MKTQILIAIGLIFLAVLTRLIPHPWNMTAVGAVAIFSGAYLAARWAFVVPLIAFLMSDLILGLHDTLFFTYGSIVICTALSLWFLKGQVQTGRVVLMSLTSSLVFFLVTNFGVWAVSGFYTQDARGLLQSYVLALPFLEKNLIGDLLFSGVLFAAYEAFLRSYPASAETSVSR